MGQGTVIAPDLRKKEQFRSSYLCLPEILWENIGNETDGKLAHPVAVDIAGY
jgi:hypothetical protein